MYIRRIQIQGFKSFPDRTVLEFGPGITAIVGPNGCGKSNILDALRWCFGTQSPRQLRGASMQDVVFSGSDGRSAAGFAEVAVTFANDAGRAPAPWQEAPEIRIERRINRDGEGEYRIQGAKARLRDIHDLLMDIGYGDYSLIQQGTVGQLVQARPHEVRELIEQAGRMTKYRARREEAQGRLAAAEENLVRVEDLIGESARLVRSLERQAARAREGRQLLEQLRAVRAIRLLRLRASVAARLADVEAELVRGGDELAAVERDIAGHDAASAAMDVQLAAAEGRLLELDAAWQGWREKREAAVGRLAGLRAEAEGLQRSTAADARIRDEAAAELARRAERSAELAAASDSADRELQRSAAARAAAHEALLAARAVGRAAADAAGVAREAAIEGMRDEAAAVNRRTAAEIELRHLTQRRQALAEQRESAQEARRTAAESARSTESAADAARRELGDLEARAAQAAADLQTARAAATVAESERLAAARSLDGEQRALDRLRAALKAGGGDGDWEGWTSLWLRVEPAAGFADLVETALAGRLATLVGGDPSALDDLTRMEARRAFLLPGDGAEAPAEPAGYRAMHELIDAAGPADRRAVMRLTTGLWLSSVPLGPSSERPATAGEEIWDVDGRCLDGRGVLTMGPLQSEGVAHLAAERAEVELRVAASERALREADAAEQAARAATAAAQSAAEDLRDRQAQALLAAEAAEASSRRAAADLAAADGQAARLSAEDAALAAGQVAAEAELARATQDAADAAARLSGLRIRLDEASRAAAESAAAAEGAESAARAADEGWQQAMQAAREAGRVHGELRQALDALSRTRDEAARRLAAAAPRTAAVQQDIGEAEAAAGALAAEGDSLAAARQSRQVEMSELRNRQSALAADLRKSHEIRASRLAAQADRAARRVALQSADAEGVAAWTARFGADLPLDEVDDGRSEDDLAAADAQLSARLDRLGGWDADAEVAHAEETARHDNLLRQRDDVAASIASLRESIARMNKESRTRFEQTFREIDARFREIFTQLFRGGHAELRLCEPEDWLESGVEIVARPPGTQLQRLELLSGGQSAMTAIALVLAIFMTHPSPFCILDEVDAPLDDANIARFNQVVIDLNRIAQIFLITHNKATMEIAGTLYGITMETRGISRAVPARLG